MPNIKQAQQPPANLKDMAPVSVAASSPAGPRGIPPQGQTGLGQQSIGPVPSTLGTVYDTVRQWIRPQVPQFRIFPLPVKANIQLNSLIKSIIEQSPTSAASVDVNDLVWQGTWSSSQTYNQYDSVQFNISTYMALNTSTGVEPDGNPLNWVLVSKNINLKTYTFAPSTASFVQSKSQTGSAGGSSVAFTSNNTAGNFIIVFVGSELVNGAFPIDPGTVFGVSDSRGNVYHPVIGPIFGWYSGTGGGYRAQAFVAYNIAGGANTITMTASGSQSNTFLAAGEYAGNGNINPIVASGSDAQSGNPDTPLTSVIISTTQVNQIVASWTVLGNSSGMTPAGFNNREPGYIDKTISGVGAALYTFSPNNTDVQIALVLSDAPQGSSTQTYYPSDVVIVDGVTYINILKAPPGTSIFDPTHWAILAGNDGFAGVNLQTANYLAVAADSGKLISMNGTGLTLTLPAAPPSTIWSIAVENTNASSLLLSPNGLDIDGTSASLVIPQNQGLLVYTDGVNYFTERGLSSGSTLLISENLTGQSANVAATTLYSVPITNAGLYRIDVFLIVSQAATSSSTLPDSRIIYTDQDSGATITIPVTSGLTTNTLSTFAQATFVINAKASTNIQFDIGQVTSYASSGATSMQFAYRARAEYLT